MKKLLIFMILLNITVYTNDFKESPKAKSARLTYEKTMKSIKLLTIKANVQYVKDLKEALIAATKKGDLAEANRIQAVIDNIDIPIKEFKAKKIRDSLIDKHEGHAGRSPVNNIYKFTINKSKKVMLIINCSLDGHGTTTNGLIYINDQVIRNWTELDVQNHIIEIDITKYIEKNGDYEVKFQYKAGNSALKIHKVEMKI